MQPLQMSDVNADGNFITRKNYTITGAIGIIHSINSINPTDPTGMENPTDVIMMKTTTKSMTRPQ